MEYVVIGAVAFPVHGYSRGTLDVDVFIRPTPQNAARTFKALRKFGYDVTDVSVEDLLQYKVLLRQYTVECDIHPFVTGVTFDEVWKSRVKADYEGVKCHFASLDCLIRMKEAAGRPRDIDDLVYLRALKKNRRKKRGR